MWQRQVLPDNIFERQADSGMTFTHQRMQRIPFTLQDFTTENSVHNVGMRAVQAERGGMDPADTDVVQQCGFFNKAALIFSQHLLPGDLEREIGDMPAVFKNYLQGFPLKIPG
jgi:hypothetical protein